MNKNDLVNLTVTDITETGSGIGKVDKMAVFVPNTAVGDRVNVKIVKVKKNYAYGIINEIEEPSPDRCENLCAAFPKCGGCIFRHINYEAELKIKENRVYETVKRIGKVDLKPQPIIRSVKTCGYRNKAQYPVNEAGAGFYSARSHRIVPISNCDILPEEFSALAKEFSSWIKENNLSVYSEETKKGLIRHFYLRRGEKTCEYMAVVVINGESLPFAEKLVEKFKAVIGDNLKSLMININKKDTNVILGDENRLVYGRDYITDILLGKRFRLSPNSFYQVNSPTAELLYLKAKEYADLKGNTLLDLYCGAGTIGLTIGTQAERIIGVEIVEDAVKDAEFNAQNNGITNAEFICADALKASEKLREKKIKADTVIVDPPRKGCSGELLSIIANDFSPERVVYISCDVSTLARDIKILTEMGYELREYTPVDMFPRTPHVETVALLSRQKGQKVL